MCTSVYMSRKWCEPMFFQLLMLMIWEKKSWYIKPIRCCVCVYSNKRHPPPAFLLCQTCQTLTANPLFTIGLWVWTCWWNRIITSWRRPLWTAEEDTLSLWEGGTDRSDRNGCFSLSSLDADWTPSWCSWQPCWRRASSADWIFSPERSNVLVREEGADESNDLTPSIIE